MAAAVASAPLIPSGWLWVTAAVAAATAAGAAATAQAKAEGEAALEQLKKEHDDWGTLLMTMDTMEDADWENNWKQYYKPFNVGDRLYVCPSWEKAQVPQGRVLLTMDPASSFGTGSHASTQLCLEGIEEYVVPGKTVLETGEVLTAIVIGKKAPGVCPVCAHPQSYFEIHAENY